MSGSTISRRNFATGIASASVLGVPVVRAMSLEPKQRRHRIRHFVMATDDLAATCQELYTFLDLPPTPPRKGNSPTKQFGFETSMMKVGNTLLEVVQPITAQHTLHDWMAANGGPGGYMVVLQTFDAEALKVRAESERLALTRDMMFRGQHMIQFDVKHFGTHFEVYQYTPEDNWWGDPVGRNYPDSSSVADIVACEVKVAEPEVIAPQVARLFLGELAGSTVRLENHAINFTKAEHGQGLKALEFKVLDEARRGEVAVIRGLELRLV